MYYFILLIRKNEMIYVCNVVYRIIEQNCYHLQKQNEQSNVYCA